MTIPIVLEEVEAHTGWLRVVRRKLQHPNGGIQNYEIVNPNSHSVCVVAFNQDNDVIMVELYRFGQQRRLLELPAGGVEKNESYAEAIERELLEETGYRGEMVSVGQHYIAAEHGVTRHVFVARNCVKISEPSPEQSEIDEGMIVKVISLDTFKEIVRRGELTETAAAFIALDHLGLL